MRLTMLALAGLWDTGLTVMLDVFSAANGLSAREFGGTPHFDVSIAGVRRKVRSAQGLSVPVKPITPELKPDWVVVPALGVILPEHVVAALSRPDVAQAIGEIRRWHDEGVRIAASCKGTFLVAEAGLLDHREATTTW